ncbi:MAG: integrase [Bacteroidetes bacterium]|nr:MAG: integrase [Bacteroidota bacterium]
MKRQTTNDLSLTVDAYLQWMASRQYSPHTIMFYQLILKHWISFTKAADIDPSDLFTYENLKVFKHKSQLKSVTLTPIRGLARYLYENDQLDEPVRKPREALPDIYEEYLAHYKDTRNVTEGMVRTYRNVFSGLYRYLHNDDLKTLTIQQIDTFLKHYNAGYSPKSQRTHRGCLRAFLQYLYCQRNILQRDLSTLLIGPPCYAQAKPPRFLRPDEVDHLFSSFSWNQPRDIRCNAMTYLAYTLGLRPKEISLVTLDDISFSKKEIRLHNRKNTVDLHLPLPEEALKAVVAYATHARPKIKQRALFLNLTAPHRPIGPYTVSSDITACLRKAGIAESAYCLRHTYAQNLLEAGASIFQVKEMLGHDRIQTTQRYIHVHTQMMRKRLFDETL